MSSKCNQIIPNKKILKLNKPLRKFLSCQNVSKFSKKTYLSKDDKLSEDEKNQDFYI